MDRFQELLWDLGEIIELPLHVDKNHACCILLDERLKIQMEMSSEEESLLVASFLSELPPGRFRENILKEALKLNGTYHPFGTFAYIKKTNVLLLHKTLLAKDLNGQKLADFLEIFAAEAERWQNAIANSQAAPSEYLKTHHDRPSLYNPQKNV